MSQRQASIHDWLTPLRVNLAQLLSLAQRLSTTYSDLALHSRDQFLATPITKLPTGHETGEYLTIDLGGTNLRIAFVTLLGNQQDDQSHPLDESLQTCSQGTSHGVQECMKKGYERSWPIGEQLKVEKAEDLFAWVGDCLAEVVEARFHCVETPPVEIPLGITFSFPMIQAHIGQAALMPMGKGFAITSDHELGAMVLAGYERYTKPYERVGTYPSAGLPRLKITAIANDAVATLLSLAYSTRPTEQSKTVLGLILGTGCNAAVPMKLQALGLTKWLPNHFDPRSTEVVVNTELTIRGAAGPLREMELITRWDKALDKDSPKPGFQPFEQMTAGSYLGEIVRLVVLEWYTNGLRFDKACLPAAFLERNGLTTTFLAQTVATVTEPQVLSSKLRNITGLEDSQHWMWTAELAAAVLEAERAVLRRSAALIGAAIMGLLLCSGDVVLEQSNTHGLENTRKLGSNSPAPQNLIVAYCGGLICLYPSYKEQIQEYLDALLVGLLPECSHIRIVLQEASEGGVVGAAVLSATTIEH